MYVLAHCYQDGNLKPMLFTTFEAAKKAMRDYYEDWTADEDVVFEAILSENHACVTYSDDTYDELDIYEVKVEDNFK